MNASEGNEAIQQPASCMVVVLTGGIASGKTYVSDRFAALGVPVVDTDLLARKAVHPGTQGLAKVVERFGDDVLNADGTLNRRKLRDRVFKDESERKALEAILHPEIRRLTKARILELGTPSTRYCIVVIPLLAETGVPEYADRVLLVSAPRALRRERLMARDGISIEAAERMIAAQATTSQRRAIANDVIKNDGTLSDLDKKIASQHEIYLKLATQWSPSGS